jgi:cyclomaltodextrinase / maltogenic alpha-amylase / neopullulanase
LKTLLALALLGGMLGPDGVDHTFVYRAERELRSVNLAGSFNNWDRTAMPMTLDADGRTWSKRLRLPYGKHSYKFVLNGDEWITDPKSQRDEDDGNGHINSILFLLPPDYARPASPTDGVTAASALQHRQEAPFLNYDRGKLTLRLRARPDDLRQVRAYVGQNRYLPMTETSRDELYAYYSVEVEWDRRQDLHYGFFLDDGPRLQFYGADGLQRDGSGGGHAFTLSAKDFRPFEVPAWVERTVFYQIFPDRFRNADRSNDPENVVPWDATPTYYNRYGGDAAGVREKIPYLKSLGVSSIYFNPVFVSPSNHRYEADDYFTIDPEIGTNEEFVSLTRELRQAGIRTVLDGVFNHTSPNHRVFRDIREREKASPYLDWYFIKSFPIRVGENPNYEAWWGFPSMPKVNLLHPPARDYMLGVVTHWQREAAVDGWRLDVANEVPMEFWRAFRDHVKGIDKDLWIVGEVWGDGSPWLKGDQWDSVMNYQFRDANLRFFAEGKTTPTQFLDHLMRVHHSYAPQVSRNMMNLLSSHDTPRFLTLSGSDASLHKLAAAVQFTWVGAPSVYYGEEVGMEGGPDPDNRRGMRWDLATDDNPMLAYYRRLAKIRNESRALQSGDPEILLADDRSSTFAYARTLGNEFAILAANRSSRPQTLTIALPPHLAASAHAGVRDALGNHPARLVGGSTLRLTLPPRQAAIILPTADAAGQQSRRNL